MTATVVQNQNGKIDLQLPQGATVSARTELPLQTGQQLRLTVTQLQPQVTLSIQKPAPPPAELLSQRATPQQQPLQQALQNLTQMLQSPTTPKMSQQAIQQLLQNLPTLVQLIDPKQLKTQISKSGTFMENNLVNNRGGELKGDLKMQLLQMKSRILNQPDQQNQQKMLKQVDALIARIETNQLKSLQSQTQSQTQTQTQQAQTESGAKESAASRSWDVEVPFLVQDQPQEIGLKFRQQQESDDPDKQRWHIEINLSPPGLGAIQAHAIYHNSVLDIHFLSEREETANTISEQIDHLQAALSTAGVEPGTLFSRQMSVNDQTSVDLPHLSNRFSIKA